MLKLSSNTSVHFVPAALACTSACTTAGCRSSTRSRAAAISLWEPCRGGRTRGGGGTGGGGTDMGRLSIDRDDGAFHISAGGAESRGISTKAAARGGARCVLRNTSWGVTEEDGFLYATFS